MLTDGLTDRHDETIVAFHSFLEAPEIYLLFAVTYS